MTEIRIYQKSKRCKLVAELDIILDNKAVFELKALGQIDPKVANQIADQISRQKTAMKHFKGNHLGLIIEDYTHVTKEAMDILTAAKIQVIKISEVLTGTMKVSIK